ncbi:MAG: TrkH family potassium uptake protein [Clostridia bacterium]|nr:TrkH family potassium uptake protein [Clostridia bacterium]
MNYKMVFGTVGRVLAVESVLMLLPAIVSLLYNESAIWAILVTAGVTFLFGALLSMLCRKSSSVIYAKEGFAIVALSWILMSVFGALPFVLSGEIPNYIDAYFEIVSGFTTTGATILRDVEIISKGLLFWRSFSHWIGGMGVLVFIMAIMPKISDRSMHILRAEMPGHSVGKLVPKAKSTARILYLIYIVMTIVQMILLLCGGMSLFDSTVISLGTAGTGGFTVTNAGIGGYSAYCQWIILVFMFLYGINFNLYYMLLIKKAKSVFKSEELWSYVGILSVSTVIITINTLSSTGVLSDTVRHSAFQSVAFMTTTGFSTANFNDWPSLSKALLLILMFLGGCGGSTAGGLKISRFVLMCKLISREFRKMLHPTSVHTVRFEGKQVDEKTLSSVTTYFALYMLCIFVVFIALSFEPFGLETNFSVAVSSFNNIGPGFGSAASHWGDYSAVSKLILSFSMLLGRLEIFPLLITLSPTFKYKK